MNDPDDPVSVPVPRRYLMDVYGFLADLSKTRANGNASGEAASVTWPVKDLRQFAKTSTKSTIAVTKVLDVLAEYPGEYISTSQLEVRTGVPRANLKGSFSGLTRHINSHYNQRGWMLEWRWGPDLGQDLPAETHYRLDPEVAAKWKEARESD
jgi:hypothetical protein